MDFSNLESFLKSSTPAISTQFLPRWAAPPNAKDCPFFVLKDLWDCYNEWSAYGRGVPIRLNGREPVVQYFVPYLSALQLYTLKSVDPREGADDIYLESETESTSSDNEESRLSRTNSNASNRIWDSDDSGTDGDVEMKTRKRPRRLYCQYFEESSPHNRLPFRDMIQKLSEEYAGVDSLRSIDLTPASWMSVAWYPIYHLPVQRNPKDLSTAFLTFHSLSASSKVGVSVERLKNEETSGTVRLPPFGLAAYRMQRRVWFRPDTDDSADMNSLLNAATYWVAQVDGFHPDFTFFLSRSMC